MLLAAGQLRMKPGPNLEQTAYPSIEIDPAHCRLCDSGENLEQGGLARAVAPDHAHNLARHDVETHIPQRPEMTVFRLRPIASTSPQRSQCARGSSQGVGNTLAQVAIGDTMTDSVALAQALDSDDRSHALASC